MHAAARFRVVPDHRVEDENCLMSILYSQHAIQWGLLKQEFGARRLKVSSATRQKGPGSREVLAFEPVHHDQIHMYMARRLCSHNQTGITVSAHTMADRVNGHES